VLGVDRVFITNFPDANATGEYVGVLGEGLEGADSSVEKEGIEVGISEGIEIE